MAKKNIFEALDAGVSDDTCIEIVTTAHEVLGALKLFWRRMPDDQKKILMDELGNIGMTLGMKAGTKAFMSGGDTVEIVQELYKEARKSRVLSRIIDGVING